MHPCKHCHIEEKVHICCGRYPADGFQVYLLTAEGRRLLACPYLDGTGLCRIYDQRPANCRNFYCDRYDRPLRRFIYCGL